jgi:hypothetical protein
MLAVELSISLYHRHHKSRRSAGTLISPYLQTKQERLKWLRDKHVESYSNTIRYLTRALNKRSNISIESGNPVTIMGQDVLKEESVQIFV